MKQFLKLLLHISLPFLLGFGILWWMYRTADWESFARCVTEEMDWTWMAVSLAIGIVPGVARGLRWRMALKPLGEKPRRSTCIDAVFMSYAASLVIPRVGEVTRCGTLKTYDGTSFTQSLGTVVTERAVDSLLMLVFTGVAFLSGLPVLLDFLHTTDTNFNDILSRFTGTGYLVTFVCLLAALLVAAVLIRRLKLFRKSRDKGKDLMRGVWEGIASLKKVDNVWLYILYSVLIWVGYFLHFYTAFFCFPFTAGLSLQAAFLIFCIGTFAVLVPTPNGAGPWHFAVKTMLVIYGVAESQAILWALAVHTIQTALVVVLGVFGCADLMVRRKKKAAQHPA